MTVAGPASSPGLANPALLPLRHPLVSVAVVVAVTALAVAPIAFGRRLTALTGRPVGLRMDFRAEKLFPARDPRLAIHDAFADDFGRGDRTALILLRSPGVLERASMERIHRITEDLRAHPLADRDRVSSLSHVTYVRAEDDWLRVEPLFDAERVASGEAAWAPAAMADGLLDHPLYENRIIGRDADIAAFVVPLDPRSDTPRNRNAFAAWLHDYFAAEVQEGEEVHLDGIIITRHEVLQLMTRDSRTYYPVAAIMLLVILAIVFRSVLVAAITTVVVILAAVWTVGLMAAADIPLNLISTAIPVLIVVAGVGDAVHLLARHGQLIASGLAPRAALFEAVSEVSTACLLTSVTTAAGFLSLAISDVEVIREFGIPVGFGIMAAYAVTFLLLGPILLVVRPPAASPHGRTGLAHRFAAWIWRLVDGHAPRVIAGALLLTLAAAATLPLVRIESRMLGDFGPESRLVRTRTFTEEHFGGVSALELVVRVPRSGSVVAGGPTASATAIRGAGRTIDDEVLAAVDRVVSKMRGDAFRERGVLYVLSVTDYLKDMNHIFAERAPGSFRLPPSRDASAQFLLLYESATPSDPTTDFITPSRDAVRVQVRIRNLWTPEFFALADAIHDEARREVPAGLDVQVTGWTLMIQAIHESLAHNLLASLVIALAVIFGAVLLVTRSLRLSLLSLIPNLLPLLLLLATMALLGIRLRMVTSVLFCVVFGIAVDDTLHFVAALHQRRALGGREAVRAAVHETGAALVLTTVILSAGFGVLLLSTIMANRLFGALSGLTLIFALLADLLLLPALVLRLGGLGPPTPVADAKATGDPT